MQNNLFSLIINKYNNNHNSAKLSIEFKKVKPEIFKDIIKGGTLTRTLDVISKSFIKSSNNMKYLRRLYFDASAKKTGEEYYRSTPLHQTLNVKDFINYSVHADIIKKEDRATPSDANPLYIFKIQIEKEFTKNWTMKCITEYRIEAFELTDGLPSFVKQVFGRKYSTDESFINEIPVDIFGMDNFNIELEYTGGKFEQGLDELKKDVIMKFFNIVDPDYENTKNYNDTLFAISKLLGKHLRYGSFGLKQLGNHARALSRFTYQNDIYPPVGFYVTEKADGIRTIIYMNGTDAYAVSNKIVHLGAVKTDGVIIADSEYIKGHGYYLFDCMMYLNDKIFRQTTLNRIIKLDIIAKLLPKELHVKKYYKIETPSEMKEIFTKVYHGKYPYDIDGIILTSANKSYFDVINYKWKPLNQETIDFVVKKCPDTLLGRPPYVQKEGKTLYLLFCGIERKVMKNLGMKEMPQFRKIWKHLPSEIYRPIQFSSSHHPYAYLAYFPKSVDYDGKVCELGPDKDSKIVQGEPFKWKFHRVREDRSREVNYYGNNYIVAETIFGDILDPFDFELLYSEPQSYFKNLRHHMYFASNYFKRYVSYKLMEKYANNAEWVLDLGGGRGADIRRYVDHKVHRAVFVDIDKTAIAELVARKFRYDLHGMEIFAAVADLKDDWKLTAKKLSLLTSDKLCAQFILSNFSFHYFCGNERDIKNMLQLANRFMKKGSTFAITCMDANLVHKKLLEHDGSYELHEGEVLKYAIDAQYEDNEVGTAGQYISVLLPFSNGEMYDEPLCNITAIIEIAKKYKLSCVERNNFCHFMNAFKSYEPQRAAKLSEVDIEYIGLHEFVVFKKV